MSKKRNLIFISLLILGVFLITGCWLIPTPTYTVTYDGNGHTGGSVPNDSTVYKENDTVTVLDKGDLVKAGYTFVGWNTQADGTGTSQAEGSVFTIGAADVTLYAQWTTNSYTVTFRSQGGSAVSSQTVEHGGKVTEPTAPRWTGHTFGGWYKESGCTNAWDFANDTVTANVTLYAKWTINTYTVTFDSHDGSAVDSQSVDYGGKVTEPADPTKTGHTFGGWYKESGCINAWVFATDTVTSNVTLYAKWKLPITAIGAITGTAKVGIELTAGALTPSGATATYQWQICATSDGEYADIDGATSTTYTPVAGDVDKFIKVVATGTGNYFGSKTSAATEAVAAAVIDIAEISGVTAPVTGGTPVTEITPTDQYTGAVTWDPAHETFAGITVYTATITLTEKAGYTLTGVTENFFSVEGAAATNAADSGVVTAVFPETAPLAIGDSYGGGKVAYILQEGETLNDEDGDVLYSYNASVQHGLIAATDDQSIGIQWFNGIFVVTGATGTAIGTGQANTAAIVNIQGAGSYAAQLCNDLTVGGYEDWYLPSRDELNKLFPNRAVIGGFAVDAADGFYWSSSEHDEYSNSFAWYQDFADDGDQYFNNKYDTRRVRAVRAF